LWTRALSETIQIIPIFEMMGRRSDQRGLPDLIPINGHAPAHIGQIEFVDETQRDFRRLKADQGAAGFQYARQASARARVRSQIFMPSDIE
jgi:hypothetical protein